MINIVIIGHNEGDSILSMRDVLHGFPAQRIWVLDRCTDDSEKTLQELGEFYVKTDDSLTGRRTSCCRNLGLSLCHRDADVLFLDGDRFPVSGALSGLETWDKDIALLLLEDEERNLVTDYHPYYGEVFNLFFSCGIFLKRKAVDAITTFQHGELFRQDLQADWGIEDTYLGDVCYHLRLMADIYKGCRLNGTFNKRKFDSPDVLARRLNERKNLKVNW